jgi:hypothetical protein
VVDEASMAGNRRAMITLSSSQGDGSFIVVVKVPADDALVQNPSQSRPKIIKRTEFEQLPGRYRAPARFKQATPEGSTLYIAAFGALRMPNDRSRIGCLATAERFAP